MMMRLFALCLLQLSWRVTTATVEGRPVRDAIDFSLWLIELSEHATNSTGIQDFFSKIRHT